MKLFRNLFTLYFDGPDPAGGGGAGTQPAPGTPPVGQGPPAGAAPGAVPGTSPQGAGVRQFFPDVPDEQWAIMEPHVGRFEGTVTQLQQQVAGFKPLIDAGYDPQRLQGLANFETNFANNPLETWIQMGQMLQQGENGQPPAVHPDVDLEYLAAIARGEDPDAAPGVPQGQPGAPPGQQPSPELAAAYEQIQTLTRTVEQMQQGLQQDQVSRQTAIEDQVLTRRLGQMRETLTKSGWPEDLLTDENLGAQVIMYRGDYAKATKALLDQRAALLKGITDPRLNPNNPNPGTQLPNGAPPSRDRQVPRRDENDPWKKGTRNAEARLSRMNGRQPG